MSLAGCYKTEIPEYVKEIGPFAFCGQTKLKKVTIPSHIRRVNEYPFDGCSGLMELKIEMGIEHIGEYCFRNCTNFETIYLPNTKIDRPHFQENYTPNNRNMQATEINIAEIHRCNKKTQRTQRQTLQVL